MALAAFNLLFIPAAACRDPSGGALAHAVASWSPLPGGSTSIRDPHPSQYRCDRDAVDDLLSAKRGRGQRSDTADLAQGPLDTAIGASLAAAAAIATIARGRAACFQSCRCVQLRKRRRFCNRAAANARTPGRPCSPSGIIEAGLVAAMTISTSSAYALGEAIQARHSLNLGFSQGRLFYGVAIASTLVAAGVVLIPARPFSR